MISAKSDNVFDTIVVGSGIGGLATASILSQVGKERVLVLESHFKLGGFLHSFRRGKYVWDPGVHYIGEMQEGSLTRRSLDLVTGGRVEWNKIKARYDRFIFPDAEIEVPACPIKYQQELTDRFPGEARAIKQYFRDIKSIKNWSQRWFFSKQFPRSVASIISSGRGLALKNTQDYLDARFKDSQLKAILTAQWPDYGTPPDESAFGIHAIVAADFQYGGYYPVGGSQKIADSAVAEIEKHGGKCLASHPVDEILIRENQAYGVSVTHQGQRHEFYAPKIVSNAGAATTFGKLIEGDSGKRERAMLRQAKSGTSAIVLFLGLNDDPRRHGFTDCNYWFYSREDHNHKSPRNPGEMPPVEGAFLSIGSLRNPGQEPHTAQIVTFSRESDWAAFADSSWLKRGDEYVALKERFAMELLDFVEDRVPGLKKLVEFQELSTPLTIKSFTGHEAGQIYGRECTPERLKADQWSIFDFSQSTISDRNGSSRSRSQRRAHDRRYDGGQVAWVAWYASDFRTNAESPVAKYSSGIDER